MMVERTKSSPMVNRKSLLHIIHITYIITAASTATAIAIASTAAATMSIRTTPSTMIPSTIAPPTVVDATCWRPIRTATTATYHRVFPAVVEYRRKSHRCERPCTIRLQLLTVWNFNIINSHCCHRQPIVPTKVPTPTTIAAPISVPAAISIEGTTAAEVVSCWMTLCARSPYT